MLTTVIHEGNSLEDNMWTHAFLDRLGIQITYDWIARSDEKCGHKWSVSVAAGDVPDMMEVQLIDLKRLHEPVELEESAAMDGAGHWTILWKKYIPTSLAALATPVLFAAVTTGTPGSTA